jgi:hypothetical protein
MAIERSFVKTAIRMDGITVGCHRLKCSQPSCDFEGEVLDRHATQLPASVIIKQFKRKGWTVGSNPKHDICPGCVERISDERRAKKRRQVNLQQKVFAKRPSQQIPALPDNIDSLPPRQQILILKKQLVGVIGAICRLEKQVGA